jgi:hypothetical protein
MLLIKVSKIQNNNKGLQFLTTDTAQFAVRRFVEVLKLKYGYEGKLLI